MFDANQWRALEVTERVASIFSLLGTTFIFVTFVLSPSFRKPINRLVFYASWGNTLCNVATLISLAGIHAGQNSHLCQFQGFVIQVTLPADAMWNMVMAFNVYLTVFRKYNAAQLRTLEWRYMLACYGIPSISAIAYLFINTPTRGRIYGPATLWCWVTPQWDFLRVALVYGPVWVFILITFTIYTFAGREIFKKRQQLRSFNTSRPSNEPIATNNPFTSYKTTEVHVTTELANVSQNNSSQASLKLDPNEAAASHHGYDQYTVIIETAPMGPLAPTFDKIPESEVAQHMYRRYNNAAMEANTAAWAYTKCALLFFVSLLITWVPASINRVYSLVHPGAVSFPFNYAAGLVLPLMGFWNTVIYVVTSWAACQALFAGRAPIRTPLPPSVRRFLGLESGARISLQDSFATEARKRRSFGGESTEGLAE